MNYARSSCHRDCYSCCINKVCLNWHGGSCGWDTPLSLFYSSGSYLANICEDRDARPGSRDALIVCLCPAWSCHHTQVGRWMERLRSVNDVAWNERRGPPAALWPRDGMCCHAEPQRETFIKGLAPTLCSDTRMRAAEKTRMKRSKPFSSTILCMRGDAGGVSGGNQNKVQRSPLHVRERHAGKENSTGGILP